MGREAIDEKGHRYGKLVVLGRAEKEHWRGRRDVHWWCRCDCGGRIAANGTSLRNGHIRSCGCLQRESASLPPGVAAFNKLVRQMRNNARKRDYVWHLTDEQVAHLTKQPCYYCGTEPNQVSRSKRLNGVYIYNGLDRLDNTRGYTIDNVVPCCFVCNQAKRSMTVGKFESWIVRAYEHLAERGRIGVAT